MDVTIRKLDLPEKCLLIELLQEVSSPPLHLRTFAGLAIEDLSQREETTELSTTNMDLYVASTRCHFTVVSLNQGGQVNCSVLMSVTEPSAQKSRHAVYNYKETISKLACLNRLVSYPRYERLCSVSNCVVDLGGTLTSIDIVNPQTAVNQRSERSIANPRGA